MPRLGRPRSYSDAQIVAALERYGSITRAAEHLGAKLTTISNRAKVSHVVQKALEKCPRRRPGRPKTQPDDGTTPTRYCGTCKTWKPITDFYLLSKGGTKRQQRCKPCDNRIRMYGTRENPGASRRRKKPCPECADIPDRRPRVGLCQGCGFPHREEPPMTVARALELPGPSNWSHA